MSRTVSAMAAAGLVVAATAFGATSASADAGITVLRSWPYGVCLDGNSSGSVYSSHCNTGAYQNWLLHDATGPYDNASWPKVEVPPATPVHAEYGAYQIISGGTWRCLDSNASGAVYTNKCDSHNRYQAWDEIVWDDDSQVHSFVNVGTHRVLQIKSYGQISTSPYPGYGHVKEWDFKRGF